MGLATQVKPLSYVKANAAQILDDLEDGGEPVIVTRNGEVKAVVQSIADYERTQETLALLKILAMGRRDAEEGRVKPAHEVIERLRRKIADA